MEEFKKFLKAAGIVLAILLTIIASVGAICFGSIYTFAGVCNFGWLYYPIREVVKYFKNRNASAPAGKGSISQPVERGDNHEDTYKQKSE
ncbi:MAG: hypothetical protein J6T35_03575 [Bacteroidales bacterium]|nr:hypothetical protein [Bacteroidales bacterium]